MVEMDRIYLELVGDVPYYLGMGIKVFSASILGGMIGLDRERKLKSAGFKTNMLICLGATLYTAISLNNWHDLQVKTADPNRVVAQIVSGIGFLGAGAILHGRHAVTGLTTAASIWVVAAIGVTIGLGYPLTAFLFTVTLLAILSLLGPLYSWFRIRRTYCLHIKSRGSVKSSVESLIGLETGSIIASDEEEIAKKGHITQLTIMLHINPNRLKALEAYIEGLEAVESVDCQTMNKKGKKS